ncbi:MULTISPECIES: hypothetical protein [Paraburkholderia]|uniref:Uncharacterized protein n=1 Tax=Paraburkholderia madseniana TaxID=2599607 RepID=A0AAP5BIE3_9BURK|nr:MULTISPECIES: hypothetical protein [Paraburkholderia]MCX4150326.1 hypothetical protein [Paraburkholderia madseniana]MDN7153259.1 hypothetical protein [Paraburkholderia sp. WS6]MDQ6412141.1 hypothetical protein [Paraburkholderia madseniana]
MMTRPTAHRWTFPARFQRGASGRKSALPIQRLKEVVAEIRQIARKELVVAADGAVSLLEKLSPALKRVDSSFGTPGTAVNRAVDAPVPVIAGVDAPAVMRERWLERLFDALQNNQTPCIDRLGERWSELRVTPAMPPHGLNWHG